MRVREFPLNIFLLNRNPGVNQDEHKIQESNPEFVNWHGGYF